MYGHNLAMAVASLVSVEDLVPKNLNFLDLSEQFTRYYAEFEESFARTEFAKGSEATCFVTFGISGAGKVNTVISYLTHLTS